MNVLVLLGVICAAFALGFALARATMAVRPRAAPRTRGSLTPLAPRPPGPTLRVIVGGRRSAGG